MLRRFSLLVCLCASLALVTSSAANAATLYGATGGNGLRTSNTGILYTIDPATGAATAVGPIGFGVTGLAVDPTTGVLYGSTTSNSANSPLSIITIDKSTGAGTLVGPTGNTSSAVADIAFDASGQLWGWSEDTDELVSINKATGARTIIGSNTGSAGDGMSFDRNGVLYIMLEGDSGDLRTIDTATGNTTVVTPLSGSPYGTREIPAASFACDGTTLYAIDGLNGAPPVANVVTVNTSTGAITNIGQTTNQMDGLVWDCTAAPASSGPAAAPVVTAVSPSSGAPGTLVGVTGGNFGGVDQVLFGGVPASFVVDSFGHLTAQAPAGPAGAVDVVVHSPAGSSAKSSADQFTYTGAATPPPPGTGGGTPPPSNLDAAVFGALTAPLTGTVSHGNKKVSWSEQLPPGTVTAGLYLSFYKPGGPVFTSAARKPFGLGSAKAVVTKAGTVRLTVRIGRRGRAQMRRHPHSKLSVTTFFISAATGKHYQSKRDLKVPGRKG